ncbi:MAG: hypothetical protein D6704_02445, partial [Nitrospirae bacterium]
MNSSSSLPYYRPDPAMPVPEPSARLAAKRVRAMLDQAATLGITTGGIAVILSILGIFVYLLLEVLPLFYPATVTPLAQISIPSVQSTRGIAVGVDEYLEVAYVLHDGQIEFLSLASDQPHLMQSIPLPDSITTVGRSAGRDHMLGLGTTQGTVIPVTITYQVAYDEQRRSISPHVTVDEPLLIDPAHGPIVVLAYQKLDEGSVIAAVTEDGRLWVAKVQMANGLLAMLEEEGREGKEILRSEVVEKPAEPITALLLNQAGDTMVVGTQQGRLVYYDIADVEAPRVLSDTMAGNTAITALAYLVGDRSIVVGTQRGDVEVWMPFRNLSAQRDLWLAKVRAFSPHSGAVTSIAPSQRNKGFVTADSLGTVALHYSTSHRTLLTIPGSGRPVPALLMAPKGNGIVTVTDDGEFHAYALDNPHPEVTLSTLFLPVLYEGYQEPLHMWQSSSGSDSFEPKFGLVPLIFGTFKGTLYAMLLATPLALLGAIYTAMFMSPALRSVIKPVVELMAALPTVVLGFLAGLWFAPLLEKIFPAVSAMFLVLPLSVIIACLFWQLLPAS